MSYENHAPDIWLSAEDIEALSTVIAEWKRDGYDTLVIGIEDLTDYSESAVSERNKNRESPAAKSAHITLITVNSEQVSGEDFTIYDDGTIKRY